MKLKTKDLLTLNELDKKEIEEILNNAIKLKKDLKAGIYKPLLKNKTLAMIFQKSSTRTRVSFETGMYQLGGHALNLSFEDLKLAWIGDGNNVCNSMIYGCVKTGIDISIATPKGYEPDRNVVKESKKVGEIQLSHDPVLAVTDADVVVTDTFVSIHHQSTDRTKDFLPKFQVNSSLMKKAKPDAIFLHCLPAKRGQEVTNSVIDGSQSAVWDEAENRLHAQKSLMISLLRV